MNKDTLQNIVSGLLSIIIGVFGYLLSQANSDIRQLKHELDLHKSRSEQRLDQGEGERRDLWNKYNIAIDRAFDDMEARFKEHTELRERITKIENND